MTYRVREITKETSMPNEERNREDYRPAGGSDTDGDDGRSDPRKAREQEKENDNNPNAPRPQQPPKTA
jgi:hypothetical protein